MKHDLTPRVTIPSRNPIAAALRRPQGARPLYAPRIVKSKRIYSRKRQSNRTALR
jgi:hypothetical protein